MVTFNGHIALPHIIWDAHAADIANPLPINLDIDRKKFKHSLSIDGIVHYTIHSLSLGLHVRYARLLQIQN